MIYQIFMRNIKLFTRDKISLMFSFLTVLITIGLYILFLSQMKFEMIRENAPHVVTDEAINYLVNSWVLAGLISITAVTSTFGSFGVVIVQDQVNQMVKDFKSSPVSKMTYPLSAMMSASVIGFSTSLFACVIYTIFIYVTTGYLFTMMQMIYLLGALALVVISNAGMMGFIVSCLTTNSSFSAASAVINSLIGFVTGLFVPMGSLPELMHTVALIFPFMHGASLFRRILTDEALGLVFAHAPLSIQETYQQFYGITLNFDGILIEPWMSVLFICVCTIIFTQLFLLNYHRKRKEM